MWALRRRLVYSFLGFLVLSSLVFFFSYTAFYKAPTCSDGIQNGEEAGVDCGGVCSLLCSSDVIAVETVWANYFKNDNGTYDVAVLLQNKNSGSAPKALKVTVLLKSTKGEILFQKDIDTHVPIAAEFPVIMQNIVLKDSPAKVIVVKEEGYSYTIKNKVINPVKIQASFDVSSSKLVFVTLTNQTKKDLLRFPVRVVLYDENKKPIGTAESFVERLLKGETKTIEVVLGKRFDVEPPMIRAYTVFDPYEF